MGWQGLRIPYLRNLSTSGRSPVLAFVLRGYYFLCGIVARSFRPILMEWTCIAFPGISQFQAHVSTCSQTLGRIQGWMPGFSSTLREQRPSSCQVV